MLDGIRVESRERREQIAAERGLSAILGSHVHDFDVFQHAEADAMSRLQDLVEAGAARMFLEHAAEQRREAESRTPEEELVRRDAPRERVPLWPQRGLPCRSGIGR